MAEAAAKRSRQGEDALRPPDGMASTYRLNDGREMPRLGFGVYRVPKGERCYRAVSAALAEGYRLVDTARLYGNEADVGRAVRESGVPREAVFVTTKVQDSDHGFREALAAGRRSVERIGLGYVDLLLIHSPGRKRGRIVETYDALLALQRQGLVRSVGVSNFGLAHLEALEKAGRPLPAVNQIEMHPLAYAEPARQDVLRYCAERGILITAYGSVFSGHRDKLGLKPLAKMAKVHSKSPAQVLLRWALQKGFQVIPKSVHSERIRENAALFDFSLSADEVAALDGMEGDLDEYWNPLGWPVDLGDVGEKPKDA
uniref:NADP-dependent oxidoreductase domain-containing protein n=1 Tax=Alexandrium monilatum TaxID=311494 RepID=A0A7S4T4W1_9DINO